MPFISAPRDIRLEGTQAFLVSATQAQLERKRREHEEALERERRNKMLTGLAIGAVVAPIVGPTLIAGTLGAAAVPGTMALAAGGAAIGAQIGGGDIVGAGQTALGIAGDIENRASRERIAATRRRTAAPASRQQLLTQEAIAKFPDLSPGEAIQTAELQRRAEQQNQDYLLSLREQGLKPGYDTLGKRQLAEIDRKESATFAALAQGKIDDFQFVDFRDRLGRERAAVRKVGVPRNDPQDMIPQGRKLGEPFFTDDGTEVVWQTKKPGERPTLLKLGNAPDASKIKDKFAEMLSGLTGEQLAARGINIAGLDPALTADRLDPAIQEAAWRLADQEMGERRLGAKGRAQRDQQKIAQVQQAQQAQAKQAQLAEMKVQQAVMMARATLDVIAEREGDSNPANWSEDALRRAAVGPDSPARILAQALMANPNPPPEAVREKARMLRIIELAARLD